jgi:mannose-1-phosphate guanylyltransferase
MAGGSGQRFWPVSRQNHPKQLLRLTSPDQSLLQEAVTRLSGLIPPERIYVITSRHLVEPIRKAATGLPEENVIAEPCKRNTAGCLVYAAAHLVAKYGVAPEDITMAVVTADHQIPDHDLFLKRVETALEAADELRGLVTIGIKPSRVETGYGYIELPENAEPVMGHLAGRPVYRSVQFLEKPTPEEAEHYVESGRYLWNSGMFFWRISSFLAEFEHANPVFADAMLDLVGAMSDDRQADAERVFAELPDISIDYALLENARDVYVAPGRFQWDDVGAWDALARTLPADGRGNVTLGEPVLVESEDCIVYNAPGAERMAVAVVGCKDLIVVTTEDGVLVVPKDRAQDVKKAVAALKERGSTQL